jgi:hypothetical protein
MRYGGTGGLLGVSGELVADPSLKLVHVELARHDECLPQEIRHGHLAVESVPLEFDDQ